MALDNFIPQVWAARLLQNLQTNLVYGQEGVINREYEGEITQYGDTVKINSIGTVSIGDYTKNDNIGDPETLSDEQRTLLIDQSKYFNFQIDDIDAAQQNPKVMNEAMSEAAFALRNVADQYIAELYADIDSDNIIGSDTTPETPTASDAYEYLVDLAVRLDEANVPEEGRWAIIPPWFEGLMLKDNRFVSGGVPESESRLQNGVIGTAAGFTVLKSNNAPNTDGNAFKIIAGHRIGWSYAEQIVSVEGYRPQQRFADAMKGLHVYGAKVVRPTALALLIADRPE